MPVRLSCRSALIFLLFLGCTTTAWAGSTKLPLAACQGQVRTRKALTGPQVAVVKPSVICFGGNIDKSSAKVLIHAIKRVPSGQPLTLVVEGSDGGDLASGLDIAKALSTRNSTVIANGMCASSCANYLWLLANHRIITKRGLLIFHGGATLALLPGINKQIEALAKEQPGMNVKNIEAKQRATMNAWIKQQDALLAKAGVDTDFFDIFNHIGSPKTLDFEPEDCKARPNAKYVVFSSDYLDSKGVKIETNKGPNTAAQVHAYLKRISPKASQETCFWG